MISQPSALQGVTAAAEGEERAEEEWGEEEWGEEGLGEEEWGEEGLGEEEWGEEEWAVAAGDAGRLREEEPADSQEGNESEEDELMPRMARLMRRSIVRDGDGASSDDEANSLLDGSGSDSEGSADLDGARPGSQDAGWRFSSC